MVRLAHVVALLVLTVLASGVSYASPIPVGNITTPATSWLWDSDSWYTNESGVCQLDLAFNWQIGTGTGNSFDLSGIKEDDPVVNQLVTNYTTHRWSDWHVQLINGTVVQGSAVVIKDGTTEPWTVTYGADPGYDSGFTAIGWPPAELVGQNEKLSIYFLFAPIDPNQSVTIRQWPTTDFVPEPGSVVSLGIGLTTLGFALRRKRR